MKKNILKITAVGLLTAFIVGTPALSRAQDADTNAPSATPAPAKQKKQTIAFRGTVSAIDTNAMTLTVETRTFDITSATKITKDGKPATLSEGVVGGPVTGAYKTGDDGKLDATTIRFGGKAAVKKKKETAAAGGAGN